MSEAAPTRERRLSVRHQLTVELDLDLCAGFGDCVREAPEAFVLNDDNVAEITVPDAAGRDSLVLAAEACPVSAILLFGADGSRLAPDL